MKKIEVISVPVTDQQASKSFYQKLGFQVLVEAPMGNGETWVQLGFPGTEASIALVNWFPKMPAGSFHGMVIKVDDIKSEIEELAGKGITVGKVDETPWGKFASITDIDGNTVNLREEVSQG